MKKLDKLVKPGSTEQPRSDFNWPPTEEELAPYGKDNTQSAHDRLRAYFNWPADDEESPAAATAASTVASQDPRSDFSSAPVDEFAAPSGPAIVQEAGGEVEGSLNWPPADEPVAAPVVQATFESSPARVDRQPDDSVLAPMPIQAASIETAEYPGVVDSPRLGVEGAQVAAVDVDLEAITGGQWDVEIARLQALIEGLTEKLEWRATGAIRNEPRPKH